MMTITTIVLLRFAVFVAGEQQFCGWVSNISSRPAGYEAHKFFAVIGQLAFNRCRPAENVIMGLKVCLQITTSCQNIFTGRITA